MHCYFVLAGDASIPILYHVERVRDGKSFVTRTVQARQRGKCIFTTTLSFMKEGSAGVKVVEHGWGLPEGMEEGLDAVDGGKEGEEDAEGNGEQIHGPFVTRRLGVWNSTSLISLHSTFPPLSNSRLPIFLATSSGFHSRGKLNH